VREFVPRNWWLYVIASAALAVIDIPLQVLAWGMDIKWTIAPAMILAVVAILGLFCFGLLAVIAYNQKAELREGGIVSHSFFGKEKLLWEEVRWVYVVRSGLPEATEIRFDLEGGKSVWLNWLLLDMEDLVTQVDEVTTPPIQARVEGELNRGEEVRFGDFLSVASNGLRYWPNGPSGEEYRLDWPEVKSFVVGRYQQNPGAGGLQGAITDTQVRILGTDGSRWAVAVANVPNFPVLMNILKDRYGVKLDML
jgi:hypothetical protein